MMTRSSLFKLLALALLGGCIGSFLGATLALAAPDQPGPTGGEPEPVATMPPVVFLSSSSSGKVDGLKFQDEDIVVFMPDNDDGTSGEWQMYFDGSDVCVGNNDVNAFVLPPPLMNPTVAVPDELRQENALYGRPIVLLTSGWSPTRTLSNLSTRPAGSQYGWPFELCFDGSQHDLVTAGEHRCHHL
ncbi:MAG: hypothetical protein R2867_16805 [Caldilineaceae bacterium]